MSLSTAVNGLWSHAEPFALSFALAGLLLAYGGERRGRLALAGLLLGDGCRREAERRAARSVRRARSCSPSFAASAPRASPRSCSPGSLPFAATVTALAWAGVFERFWLWTFVYARSYGSELSLAEGAGNLAYMLPRLWRTQLVWWLAAAVGIAAPLWSREVRARAPFLFGLLAAGALAASFGFYYRAQYFVRSCPAIALARRRRGARRGAARGPYARAGRRAPSRSRAWRRRSVSRRTCSCARRPTQVSRAVYGQNPFVEAPELGRRIAELTAPGTRIAVIGSEPEIYFYAARRAATGYIYMYPLMEPQPLASAMQDEMIAQLEAARPEILVFVNVDVSWLAHRESPPQLCGWFNATAARDYEVVARVEILSADETRWLSGADARTATNAKYWVAILRRKTA